MSEMGDDRRQFYHWVFIGFQILVIIIAACMRKRSPDRYEEMINRYLLFKSKKRSDDKENLLDDPVLAQALAEAYRHPWYNLESQVKFVHEKYQFKSNLKNQWNKSGPTQKDYSHQSHDDIFDDRDSN